MKFRMKPVVIEALQLTEKSFQICCDWIGATNLDDGTAQEECCIGIFTEEGGMTAREGDWIIKGVKGEFYPCKPDIFEATYEAVD